MNNLHRTLTALLVLAVLGGCSQHGDLPTEHSFIPAPTPTITDIIDNNDGTYALYWSVDDEAAVKHYRVYSLNPLTGQMELGATTEESEFGIDLGTGQAIGGYPIGISAVTVENVEGAMTVILTPEPGSSP